MHTPKQTQAAPVDPFKLLFDLGLQADTLVGANIDPVSTADIKQMLKMRQGGDFVVDLVAALATARNVSRPGTSWDEAQARLAHAKRIESIANLFQIVASQLLNAATKDRSECWTVVTYCYSLLSKMASADPKLAEELKPVADFFSIGKKGTKKRAVRSAAAKVAKTPKHQLSGNGAAHTP